MRASEVVRYCAVINGTDWKELESKRKLEGLLAEQGNQATTEEPHHGSESAFAKRWFSGMALSNSFERRRPRYLKERSFISSHTAAVCEEHLLGNLHDLAGYLKNPSYMKTNCPLAGGCLENIRLCAYMG